LLLAELSERVRQRILDVPVGLAGHADLVAHSG
jgi:hypothetical protein